MIAMHGFGMIVGLKCLKQHKRQALLLLLICGSAAGLTGCGPCRKPDLPPPSEGVDEFDEAPRMPDRQEVPDFTGDEGRPAPPVHPLGVETNLMIEVPGWTPTTQPLGSKWGLDGRRTYRQEDKQVFVRLYRVPNEITKVKPQFEIGYKRENRMQHVEMIEARGYPVLVNHHPPAKLGTISVYFLDGWGKADFSYRNMEVEEAMDFARNFAWEDLEKGVAAAAP